ncbi:SGNH/GDSL hydrolase family protein [Mucilaginibacter sp.]
MKRIFLCFFMAVIIIVNGCKKQQADFEPDVVETTLKIEKRITIVNKGVSGDTAADLLKRISDVTDEKPNLVLIMVGTNDAGWGGNILNTYQQNLTQIVEAIQATGATVYLMSPPPILSSYKLYSAQLIANLDAARTMMISVSNARHCKYLDVRGQFEALPATGTTLSSLYLGDGLHLSAAGYEKMSDYIYSAILADTAPLLSGLKIVCFGDSITNGYMVNGAGTTDGDTYPARLKGLFLQNN